MAIIVVAEKAQRIIPQKRAACGVRGLQSPKQQKPTAKQRRAMRKTMRLDIL
jgi:hypothetical protein